MPDGTKRSTEHWFLLLVAGGGALCLVAIALFLEPDSRGYGTHEKLGFAPCLPMKLWGIPCPGCGVTTSVAHAVRGELGQSLRAQPFGLLLFLGALALVGWAGYGHLRGRDLGLALRELRWKRWVIWAALAMLAGWVYKLAIVRGWLDIG
jgi:hypothetical protein